MRCSGPKTASPRSRRCSARLRTASPPDLPRSHFRAWRRLLSLPISPLKSVAERAPCAP
jgi:hypothetical protein